MDYVKMVADWEDIGTSVTLIDLAAMLDKEVPIQVGRTVHYRSRGSADGVRRTGRRSWTVPPGRGSADGVFNPRCVAAIVTQVWEGDQLSLAVLNPTGLFFDKDLPHDHRPEAAGGTWHRLSECQHDGGFGY